MKIKKNILIILMFYFIAMDSISFAQGEKDTQSIEEIQPWDRFSVNLGGFVAGVNTGIRIGNKQLGLGIDINLEDALGMKVSNFVFRTDAMYRFGKTKRHSVKSGFFSFTRSAKKVLEIEIEIGDHIFPIGTDIESRFDLSIFNVAYDYSFFSDDRINMGASIGFFIMPIKFEIGVSGITEEATDFVAPLPVIGLRTDFIIRPKLLLKQNIEILYIERDDFLGSIVDINFRLEYNILKNLGFGLGINMYKLRIEAKGADYPGIDMIGNIQMGYNGLLIYGRYFF